jgi:hypothetical protein
MKVHPIADLFPMLVGEEFAELVEDITQHGLLEPIKLDREGRILDGRNRYAACQVAGVAPRFVTYDGPDEAAYAFSANAMRRMLTKSQVAMVAVLAELTATTGIADAGGDSPSTAGIADAGGDSPSTAGIADAGGDSPSTAGIAGERRKIPDGMTERLAARHDIGQERIAHAWAVVRWAPSLVDDVIKGGSLADAYAIAMDCKKKAAEQAERTQGGILRLRTECPDLAERLDDGAISLDEALTLARERRAAARAEAERVKLAGDVTLRMEGLPEAPLPPLDPALVAEGQVQAGLPLSSDTQERPGADEHEVLKQQHELLGDLIAMVDALKLLNTEPIWLGSRVEDSRMRAAVRTACARTINELLTLIERYERFVVVGDGRLRRMK